MSTIAHLYLECASCHKTWTMHDKLDPHQPGLDIWCPWCGKVLVIKPKPEKQEPT